MRGLLLAGNRRRYGSAGQQRSLVLGPSSWPKLDWYPALGEKPTPAALD